MQKLEKRNTCTPIGTPQADGNCDFVVKHDREVGQVLQDLKTFSNNSDVDKLRKEKRNLRVFVYVLNMRGFPLMPTTPKKARLLLKEKKAKVAYRSPFTIQLLYPTGETKQEITLGIDAGYSFVGFSANTDKKEVICGQLKLRKDVSKNISERRMYRRNRRNKLWYREPRFLNRGIKRGWLAPSLKHKFDTHIRIIEKIKQLLPVSQIIVEIATFDTQKMQNPEINGIEYQQGELQGYEIREYLLEKWKHQCAYCNKENIPLEIEHIMPKSRGGTNRISNLTISCRECNLKKGSKTAREFGYPNLQRRAEKPLKATAYMNVVKKQIVDVLQCGITYGYITKHDRIKQCLEKSHVNDAFVIARGNNQDRGKSFTITQTRRNNRSIQLNRKGFKPSIRRERYKIQPFDLVRYNNFLYRVKGMFNYGKWVRLIDLEKNILNLNVKKVELVQYGKGLQFT